MKTLLKILAVISVLALSLSVFAHMGGYGYHQNGGYYQNGFQHPMMNVDDPQYQAMQARRNDPEAMAAWRKNMQDNPQARQQWMEQMHGQGFMHYHGNGGCRGANFGSGANNNSNAK